MLVSAMNTGLLLLLASLVTVSAVENCCVKARDLGPQWAGWLDYSCDQDQASIGTGPGTAEIHALCETQISTL